MSTSPESTVLTNTLLSTVRLQRHLGARVVISTQEPSISPALLDLCSMTIVHRFTSPAWMQILHKHLAGWYSDPSSSENGGSDYMKSKEWHSQLLRKIVSLRTGEALIFSPFAIANLARDAQTGNSIQSAYMWVRIRARLSSDGGRSVLAE